MLISLVSAVLALPAAAQEAAVLETVAVEYRSIAREYRLDGVVEAVRRTTVSAQTQGQIEEILYDVDDFVEKGAVVARLKDTEHRARVTRAKAELKSSTARVQQAADEHARLQGLHEKEFHPFEGVDLLCTDHASDDFTKFHIR